MLSTQNGDLLSIQNGGLLSTQNDDAISGTGRAHRRPGGLKD